MRLNPVIRDSALLAGGLFAAGMVAGRPDDPEYYRSLKQAPYAPPAWAFGPAWAIATSGWSYSTVRMWRDKNATGRKTYLALAGGDAILYVSFSYVYFRRKSPMLAAVWTAKTAAITVAQLAIAARNDPKIAAGLAPQTAWLALATPVAIYQAAHNPDPIFS